MQNSSSQNETNNSSFRRVLLAVLKGVLFTIVLLLVFSVGMSALGAPGFAYFPAVLISLLAGGFFTGFSSTSRTASGRLMTGIISGIVYYLVIFVLGLVFNRGDSMNTATVLTNLAISLAGAIIGTVTHINSYGKRRTV